MLEVSVISFEEVLEEKDLGGLLDNLAELYEYEYYYNEEGKLIRHDMQLYMEDETTIGEVIANYYFYIDESTYELMKLCDENNEDDKEVLEIKRGQLAILDKGLSKYL